MIEWMLPASTAVVSALLTGWYLRIALARALLDIPNDRSSHQHATLRGGGIAIVVAFTMASGLLWITDRMPSNVCASLVVGGTVAASIGFLDDFRNVGRGVRILTHFAIALWALILLGGFPPTPIGQMVFDFGPAGYLPGALLLVWLLNLYNFMDGIDGIASIETITVAGCAALLLVFSDMASLALWPACLAGATAGFLVWNWPPARLFMGDAGSGFLGYVIGVLALATSSTGALTIWSWIILLGVFLSDASVTLLRRMSREKQWYAAHRSHLYQRLARRWRSHKKVTLAVFIVNLVWLWPLAAASEMHRGAGWWLSMVALGPLIVLAVLAGAGKSEHEGERDS